MAGWRLPCGLLLALSILSVACRSVHAQDAAESTAGQPEQQLVEVFTGPRGKALVPPEFPPSQLRRGGEGWVMLNFMVDPAGKAYEAAVVDSSGSEDFHAAALKALEKSVFEPAVLDGRPIDAGYGLKMTFELTGTARGASSGFVRHYRRLLELVAEGSRAEAEQELAALEPRNLYEDAFYHVARFNYLRVWGNQAEQLSALRRAVANEEDAKYLPADLFRSTLAMLFALEVREQHFARALDVYEDLARQELPEEQRASLERAVADIESLRGDERSFAVSGVIGDSYAWVYRLLKSRFYLDEIDGEIAELKLRCERDYVIFRFDPDLEYRIPDEIGTCNLEVVGDPATTFRLVQS